MDIPILVHIVNLFLQIVCEHHWMLIGLYYRLKRLAFVSLHCKLIIYWPLLSMLNCPWIHQVLLLNCRNGAAIISRLYANWLLQMTSKGSEYWGVYILEKLWFLLGVPKALRRFLRLVCCIVFIRHHSFGPAKMGGTLLVLLTGSIMQKQFHYFRSIPIDLNDLHSDRNQCNNK